MPAKYCDLHPIPSQVFKDLAPYWVEELTKLVNVSLMHGVYPKEWKLAIVKPLLKKIGMDIYDNKSVSYCETIAQENRNGHLRQQVIQACE